MKFLVANVLQREISDPRLGFVTVLAVEPTVDLREAKVKVSVLGSQGDVSKTLHALDAARGFIQRQVGKGLQLRQVPTLHFVLDEKPDHQRRIEEILDATRREDEAAAEADANDLPPVDRDDSGGD